MPDTVLTVSDTFIRTVITNLLFIQDSHCIRSNHQLFIGRDNHYLHLGIVCRDYSLFTTDLVLFQVDLDTHEFETFAYFATAVALVLADTARKHDDICLLYTSADVPVKVQMKITYTEPGLKGDTATNTLKPATVESGATVRVPLFINEGETIEIDTRDGSYVSRVKA